MILVTLGTQDKVFPRLLEAVDKWVEEYHITERIVVQAGQTKYSSKNMEILDFIDMDAFDKLLSEASLVISHGGVGTIISALNKGKVVIATPRLAKYHEHHNDHQVQIIEEFARKGHIIYLKEMDQLNECVEMAKTFVPTPYTSNRDNMVKLIMDYIEQI